MPPQSRLGDIVFSMTICLSVYLSGKNFNLGKNFRMVDNGAFIFEILYMYVLWQDLYLGTRITFLP